MRRTFMLVAAICAVAGCGKKQVELSLKVEPDGENLAVHVSTKPGADKGTLELTGVGFFPVTRKETLDVFGAGKFSVVGKHVKPGKYKLTATMTGSHQGTVTTEYERQGERPKLEFAAVKEDGPKVWLQFFGNPTLRGNADGTLTMKVVKGKGARITISGKETLLEENTQLTVDLKPAVGGLAWGFWVGSLAKYVTVPIKLVGADGGEWSDALGFKPAHAARLVLSAVQRGPVAFPGDTPAPPKPRAAAYLDLDDSDAEPRLIGQAGPMKNLDLIVVEKCTWKDIKPCGTYSSSRTVKTIRRSRCTATVTAYDRRKGTVVASKQFDAGHDPACPKSIAASRTWVTSSPDFKSMMKPWGERLLK